MEGCALSQPIRKGTIVPCDGGTKEYTAIKNNKRSELEVLLAQLGNYINNTAQGDVPKLDSTGDPISKLPEPVGIRPVPKKFSISEGESRGSLYFEVEPDKRASGYVFLYAQFPLPPTNEGWTGKISRTAKGYIRGLESGKKYGFKVAYSTSESDKTNTYNFTDPIEKFIQ